MQYCLSVQLPKTNNNVVFMFDVKEDGRRRLFKCNSGELNLVLTLPKIGPVSPMPYEIRIMDSSVVRHPICWYFFLLCIQAFLFLPVLQFNSVSIKSILRAFITLSVTKNKKVSNL